MSDFNALLDRYAELAVRVGLNVQPGQRVFVRATRAEPELVFRVARAAYRAGAALVHVLWEEDALDVIRVRESVPENLDLVIDWYASAFNTAAERGDALLLLHSPDPEMYAGIDPERVAANRHSRLRGLALMLEAQARNQIQWSVLRVPTVAWAHRMYPDDPPALGEQKIWDAIFNVSRVTESDPVAAWQKHVAALTKRRDFLTAKQYSALHFQAPKTDLTIGLPAGHVWFGGDSVSPNGISFVANIPTEEVFTLPHRDRAEGYVTMTRPLSVSGVMINNFTLTFQDGRITNVTASNNVNVLEQLIATDEGASHLGEVALVPASNPIAAMNRVFYDALFDENAASHIAMGRAYRFTLEGGGVMPKADFIAAGGNDSIIHEDTMIGSAEMNVDGINANGTREPVMHAGEWAIRV